MMLIGIVLKGFWYPLIYLDWYPMQMGTCFPTLLCGPILLVIFEIQKQKCLRNIPPYSAISHSSVIWNFGERTLWIIHTKNKKNK